MAIEKQKTFKSNFTKTLDVEVNDYLANNDVDAAIVQIVINQNTGLKTVTLTYADRAVLKAEYEKQGRQYTDADKVTYVYAKDIIVPFTADLDEEVNKFMGDDNISVLSVSRYFTPVNQGAFFLYLNKAEQQVKFAEKQAEVEKARKEMADKLAKEAIKEPETKVDDKVAELAEKADEVITTAGLAQVEGEVVTTKEAEVTTTTEEKKVIEMPKSNNKKKMFGKK